MLKSPSVYLYSPQGIYHAGVRRRDAGTITPLVTDLDPVTFKWKFELTILKMYPHTKTVVSTSTLLKVMFLLSCYVLTVYSVCRLVMHQDNSLWTVSGVICLQWCLLFCLYVTKSLWSGMAIMENVKQLRKKHHCCKGPHYMQEECQVLQQCASTFSLLFYNISSGRGSVVWLCVGNADADTFVCDFHRKQSWLRWIRTLKHNVADQQDEIMKLLDVCICVSLDGDHWAREIVNMSDVLLSCCENFQLYLAWW